MPRLAPQPHFDKQGNLIIPRHLLEPSRKATTYDAATKSSLLAAWKHNKEHAHGTGGVEKPAASNVEVIILKFQDYLLRMVLRGREVVSITQVGPGENGDILKLGDETAEMLALAQSSMGFWDNPVDDAVWNNA